MIIKIGCATMVTFFFLVSAGLMLLPMYVAGQTRISPSQLQEILAPSYAERWCPGPVMQVDTARKTMTVGLSSRSSPADA